MDRQEYREIVNEIKTGYARKDYDRVIMFARELQPRKIKEISVLEIIASSYERVGKPSLAKATLEVAYERTGTSKSMAARLVMLSLKLKDVDSAVAYYEDFCRLAPHDNQRFLLKYYIADFGGLSKKDKIKILEEYTSKELDEKWLFELAKLYHEAGMGNKCADTCDELILWFANGDYLKRALELKFAHKSLTPEQQQMYENIMSEYFEDGTNKKFDEKEAMAEAKLDDEAEEFANEVLGINRSEDTADDEKISDTSLIYSQEDDRNNEHETRMAETKRLSLHIPEDFQPEPENTQFEDEKPAEPLDYFARKALREKEEARKAEEAEKAAEEAKKAEQAAETSVVYADKQAQREAEIKSDDEPGETPDLTTFYERKKVEIKDDGLGVSLDILREEKDQVQGQFSIDQLFKTYANNIEHNEENKEAIEKIEAERLKQIQEAVGGIETVVPVFDDEFDENPEETKPDEIEMQSVEILDENFTESDPTDNSEEIESDESKARDVQTEESSGESEDEGIAIETPNLSVDIASMTETKQEESIPAGKAGEELEEGPSETQISDDGENETAADEIQGTADMSKAEDTKSEQEENEDIEGLGDFLAGVLGKEEPSDEENSNTEAEAESKVTEEQAKAVKEAGLDELDDIFAGIFGENDEEKIKAEAEVKPEEDSGQTMPEEESISETSAAQEKDDDADKVFVEEEILGFDETDENDEAQAGENISEEEQQMETADLPEEYEPVKGDTQEIEKPFKYTLDNELREELAEFLLVENMDEDITNVINNILICKQNGDESGGNLIVTGDAKTGKTFLAIAIIKAVTKELGYGAGRVAKVQAESINGKNIEKVFKKIEGNDLIIENVGDLNDEAVEGIIKAIENGTAKNMVVLESNVLAIETIVNNHPEIEKLFKNRIGVGELTISQWADVACDYAERKGYMVNDMALLALHAKIDELNIPTARFGYDNIVYIMEMAIKKADKRNTGKLFAAFKKDDNALKELTESDFM